jgi:hypothetical protein
MVSELRSRFNAGFTPQKYDSLLRLVEERCGARVEYRIAESPVFLPSSLLGELSTAGMGLTEALLGNAAYLAEARKAIPVGYSVAKENAHPNFLTADFALVRDADRKLVPRLVEIQAFPSVYGYQDVLSGAYRDAYALPEGLGTYLGGLDEAGYWALLAETVLGGHAPENVVLTELDPMHQKTLPDFNVTSRRLGIAVVDIRSLETSASKLFYRDQRGRQIPIHRIYNRAIADELMARQVRLPFDLTFPWDVEWAGHPNWYFLISKFSIPWLCRPPGSHPVVPPAVFVDEFVDGNGRAELAAAGVRLPRQVGQETIYPELLLKPLFSFAGKGIQFEPAQAQLEAIPPESRKEFLLQQRMRFEPTIETPCGPTQAEIRILYLWPDAGKLTPVLSLVRLGRGKMMGVDHNKNLEWVGASAAFFSQNQQQGSKMVETA